VCPEGLTIINIDNCVEQQVVSQRERSDTRYAVMYGATLGHVAGIMRAGSARIWESSRFLPLSLSVLECHGVWAIREEATTECMHLVSRGCLNY